MSARRDHLGASVLTYGHKLTYDMPEPERDRVHPATVTQIEDAWERAAVLDGRGVLWVAVSHMHTILRTHKKQAGLFVLDVAERDKVVIEGVPCVRAYRVVGEIFRLREESGETPRWRYLDLSAWFARAFGESHQAKLRRIEAAQDRAPAIKKLKKERMRLHRISADELTGLPLKTADAQFCHIVAQSVEPEISDCVWNGLIVHCELHARLTLAGVVTHEHLLEFCEANAMSTEWYGAFMVQYRSFFA